MKIKSPTVSLRMKAWGYRLLVLFYTIGILAMGNLFVTVWKHPEKIQPFMYETAMVYVIALGIISWVKSVIDTIMKIDEIKIRIDAWKRP